jgi:hypothetical protein
MSDIPFYNKLNFIQLMERKRGRDFTLGWLQMAYALPPVPEDQEIAIIQKEVQSLLVLPDYNTTIGA